MADPSASVLSAADYAIRERCFSSHRGSPYRFEDLVERLQTEIEPKCANGIVHQPGLTSLALPFADIDVDALDRKDFAQEHKSPEFVDHVDGKCFIFKPLRSKSLRILQEPTSLARNPCRDLAEYSEEMTQRRSCNIMAEWMPMCRVNDENDEGLLFPRWSARWQLLVWRELKRESLEVSHQALRHTREAISPILPSARELDELFRPRRSLLKLPMVLPPITETEPPLPHVPSEGAAIIDLTSEPSSPVNAAVDKLEGDVSRGVLDSDPTAPSTAPSSSPHKYVDCFIEHRGPKISDLKIDPPLLISDPVGENNGNFDISGLQDSIALTPDTLPASLSQEGFFDEAIGVLLEASRDRVSKIVEDERLNLTQCLLRMPVPVLSFDLPQVEWANSEDNSHQHFISIVDNIRSQFQLQNVRSTKSADSNLKWTPIPAILGRVPVEEKMDTLISESRIYLTLETSDLSSRHFIRRENRPRILRMTEDGEIGDLQEDYLAGDVSSGRVSQTEITNPRVQCGNSAGLLQQQLRLSEGAVKRRLGNDSDTVFLLGSDPRATSTLLSSFMELRNSKRPKSNQNDTRRNEAVSQRPPHPASKPPSDAKGHVMDARMMQPTLKPAPSPQYVLPSQACRFVVSLSLSRRVLNSIQRLWPQVDLVDRDFSQHNTVVWSSASTQRKEVESELSCEADVFLSPFAAVIITNLLKVRQRPLPGAQTLPPLRDRVRRLSRKYESLFILVSEENPNGEYVGETTPSDANSYTDFVQFVCSLGAGATVYLIPGADITLAHWVLALMCRFAPHAIETGRFIRAQDTTWSLFLRKCGFNPVAAQVIEGLLVVEFGDQGMRRFLLMSAAERVSKYGQILGGERVMGNVARVLDYQWS